MENPILLFILTIISTPGLLLVLLFALMCRLFREIVVGSYLRYKYGKGVKFLSSIDAMYAMDNPKNRTYTRACFLIKGKADVLAYQQQVYTKWIQSTLPDNMFKLSCRLCCEFGYFFWLPEKDFRIEQHCYLHNVIPKNEKELNIFYKEFFNQRFAKNLSAWSMTCINLDENFPGLEQGPHHVFLVTAHHAVSDGVSYWSLCNTYLFDQANGYTILGKNSLNHVSMMTKLKRLTRILAFGPGALVGNLLTFPDNSILHGQTLSGTKLFGFSKPVSFDRISRIKMITDTTVNDVLISCITGGLRSFFLKEGASPKCSRHFIPVAMHPLNKPPRLVNQTSALVFHDAVDQLTPKERLLKTQENMNKLKNAELAVTNFLVLGAICNFIPRCITSKIAELYGVTTVISNLPGPSRPTCIFGQKLVRLGCFSPTFAKIGLGIVAVTYNGQVQIGINADIAVVKTQENLQALLDYINNEFDELEKST